MDLENFVLEQMQPAHTHPHTPGRLHWLELLLHGHSRIHNPVQYTTNDAHKRRVSSGSQSEGTCVNERTLYQRYVAYALAHTS